MINSKSTNETIFKTKYPKSIAVTHTEYILERCANRRMLIYGTDQMAIDLSNYLMNLGIVTYKFIEDNMFEDNLLGKQIICPLDLVYENKEEIFVIIAKAEEHYGDSRQIFIDMGFVEDIEFTYHSEVPPTKEAKCYDVTLSYNRKMENIEGFELFGEVDNPKAKVIVALGGSTTESTYLFIKGWAYFLSKILAENKIPAVIYCGGVAGYSSSQELLKFIRDVLPLKPDMVLSYSGLNDLYGYPKENEQIRNGRPFITHFQVEFIERILEMLAPQQTKLPVMHDLMWHENENDTVYFGLKNNKTASELWLDNTRIMKSIANEFGIMFYSFFQPFAFNGFYKIDETQKILYQRKSPTCLTDGYGKWGKPYKEDVEKIITKIKNYDYIFDFSRIFENCDAVYFDASHVYERGNVIIANKIFENIKQFLERK